jgi:NADPH:quinone reductase-like Zn-dependent oxidoreductase
MGRRLRMIGSVLRSRSLEEKEEIRRRFMEQFWPLLENGTIRPVIDSVYPIQQANEAHERIAAYQNIGKIVLRIRA